MRLLAVNSGSSSLKLRVLGPRDGLVAKADLASGAGHALERFVGDAPPFDAAVHRFVHGGSMREPVLLDERVLDRIEAAGSLAPLHTEAALDCARALRRLRPGLPQVACFDTAFHTTLPDAAATYAVPREWIERHGIRRFGFHGLSHAWAARRAAELLGRPLADLRSVTCHLGAGVSLAAVAGGRSVDTTMGMTPNDGVVMARRSGAVDPGAVLLVAEREGLDATREGLERHAGLIGLSGLSDDTRELLAAVGAAHAGARLAIDVYVHRLRGAVASMAAAMGGMDALVFTGGVGEHEPRIRAAVCEGLGFLGAELDRSANASATCDTVVSADHAAVAVLVVRAREDLQMAREARVLLSS